VRTDAVALALIESRLAAAREQQLVTQIRRSRREARREQRSQRTRRWWDVRRRPRTARVLVVQVVEPSPDCLDVIAGPTHPVHEQPAPRDRVAV
jgi:hypothetical protein